MGTVVGHASIGLGFLLIGLWHLFNTIKLHALHPTSVAFSTWFPSPILRHLELILIISGSLAFIIVELFVTPSHHLPLDPDGTIPSRYLRNVEHATAALAFLSYASLAILFDRLKPRAHVGLTHALAAVVFAQELLMFGLHSTDHMGVEGQYHLLLQPVVVVSLLATLLGGGFSESFLVCFVRSVSVTFQGVWLVVMGFMVWTPGLAPKGCFMGSEDKRPVIRCRSRASLDRAKSIANLQFGWFLLGVVVFSMLLYLFLSKRYPEMPEYDYLGMVREEELEDLEDCESQKNHTGKGMKPMDMEW